jgi:hypothetical protein
VREDLDIPIPAGAGYRVPRHRAADPNTRRMAIVAGAIGGGLLLLVGAWSLTGPRRGGVPVVEADARPMRVKPDKAGGLEVEGKDDAIMGGGVEGKTALGPAPEAPAPQALKAQATAAESKAVAEQALLTATPAIGHAMSPLPDTKAPEAKPDVKAVENKPVETKAVEAKPAAKAVPAPVVTRVGTAQVQLAALLSEQAAMAEWARLEKKMPDVLGSYRPAVTKIERDGKALYRLRTGGFSDTGQATSFCDKVKAKGGLCSVASF